MPWLSGLHTPVGCWTSTGSLPLTHRMKRALSSLLSSVISRGESNIEGCEVLVLAFEDIDPYTRIIDQVPHS
jgi:hypothetical protein